MFASDFITSALLAATALLGVCSASAIPAPAPRWDLRRDDARAAAVPAAAPLLNRREEPSADTPKFQASNYNWGCSPGGCINSFNLTASAGYRPGAPAFDVVCNGVYIQSGWRPCTTKDGGDLPAENRVETIWNDGPDRDRQYLGAAHIYKQEDGTWVNATGYTDFLPERGMNFSFPVTIIGKPQ